MPPGTAPGRPRRRRHGAFGTNPTPVRSDVSIRERHWTSRLLHHLGASMAHSGAGATAAVLLVSWIVVGVATRFPHWWEVVLYVVTSGITFLMVFVIQHTQSRQTAATQRKLDELIRASAGADPTYIAAEEAPDDDLELLAAWSEFQRFQAQERRLDQPRDRDDSA